MITLFGILVIVVGLIVFVGQGLCFFTPELATKLGVNSPADEMDHTLYIIETKANGLSDILLTWMLPLAGFMLIFDNPNWVYPALVGGGIYIYFAFLTIFSRLFLKAHGKRVGSASDQKVAYIFSAIWIFCATTMIILAILDLS